MNKEIVINGFQFNLTFVDGTLSTVKILSFEKVDKQNPMTDDELRYAQFLGSQIYEGRWDWLIEKQNVLNLSIGKIIISLNKPIYNNGFLRWESGSITSELKEVCPHCGEADCEFDCPEALENASDRDCDFQLAKNEELEGKKAYNHSIDVIESMILAHAIAGVIVDSVAYVEGIQTALDAIGNNI